MPLNADDITAIVNLAHEYNDAVDRQDPHAWTHTYTVDGELCSPLGNPKGHEALFEWISGVVASLSGTRHCNLNEVVDGDGDGATMRSSYVVIGTNDAPPTPVVTGGYEDELVRANGRWRFARRVHTLDPSYGAIDEHPPK
jgi:ketosteroid isomerase-like protein